MMNCTFGASGRLIARLSPAVIALPLLAGCQTGGGSSGDAPPQAAISACLQHATEYQNAQPGSATFNGVARANVAANTPVGSGNLWRLEVVVGGVALYCTVTPAGSVVEISPIGGV
jgi:hypothetical protein